MTMGGKDMKKKLICFVSVLAFISLNCSKQSEKSVSEWRGAIEYTDGTKVILNPGEPLYGHLSLDLEKDLNIGSEEEDAYLFYRVEDIGVDSQGNIYVLDIGNTRIQKYDDRGIYVRTIGRKGQGPGEFDTPYGMFLSVEDIIYVHDGMRVKSFKIDGNFLKEVVLESFTHNISVDLDGNIWGIGRLPSEEGRTRSIIMLNERGKLEKIIADFPPPKVAIRSEGGRGVSFFIGHEYVPELSFIPLDGKSSLYAYSLDYRLNMINERGESESVITVDVPRSSISQKEKAEIYEKYSDFEERWPKDVVRDAIQFPPHRPFFNTILADDKGRIYVERVKSILDKRKRIQFDIFSRDGYYLYKTDLPFSPELIKDGFLYHILSIEETGGIVLQRFKIHNWAEIKESLQQ
jgi:hypothetical protein